MRVRMEHERIPRIPLDDGMRVCVGHEPGDELVEGERGIVIVVVLSQDLLGKSLPRNEGRYQHYMPRGRLC
jgi:hypothetical protein